MKRRDFIRLGGLLTVSAAALGVTGCSIDGEDDPTSPFGSPTPEPIRDMPAPATGASWQFPQSIVSADPRPDSIILWTRVVPTTVLAATDTTTTDTAIRLVVTAADHSGDLGTNADISASTLVADVQVPAYEDFDGSVRHKLTGLSANTVYFYQFIAGDVFTNVGRFKTAPAATSSDDVKFIFMSCQDYSANHWGAFSKIVADDTGTNNPDVDFIVHLGDYIYETDSTAATESSAHSAVTLPVGAALQSPSLQKSAVDLSDYRYLYKLYRSDPRLQAVHERFPIVAIWDDHEFSDDCWQNAETYSNGNLAMTSRRRNANQAWFEFMPADISFSEVDAGFQNIKLYRDLKFGQTVHLVMTDERLYRQDHLIPETTLSPISGLPLGRIFSRYLAPEASLKSAELQKEAGAPQLTLISILGRTQRDWWKSTMKNSTSKWKVWGNEVSLLRMGLDGSMAVGTLIGLQTVSDTGATMTAKVSDPQVQALPKVAAGAGTAVAGGASASVAIPACFAILQTYAATAGDAVAAVTAGVTAGLTMPQASDALAAIGAKSPSGAEIAICAATVVAATTAYMTTGMSQANASTTGAGVTVGVLLTDGAYGGAATDPVLLATVKGASALTDAAGTIVVNVYKAAKAAAGSGSAAQITDAATAFSANLVMVKEIRTEVLNNKLSSSFVIASGQIATLGAFLRKFVLNADQWDGYRKERAELMNHLIDNNIKNVVAVTGDIHASFAGTVYNEFKGEVKTITAGGDEATSASANGTAAMIDLVTAGNSSSSWFEYLKPAAASLSSQLLTLVSYVIPTTTTGLPFALDLPVLNFSMGLTFSPTNLVTMLRDAIKDGAAKNGVPESSLGGDANISSIASTIAGNTALQGLCAALSSMGTEVNPWIAYADTNAQGYAVVTASSTSMVCNFHHLNSVFVTGGTGYAPGVLGAGVDTRSVISRTKTATIAADITAVVMS
jgi:alkaline phosphatase D